MAHVHIIVDHDKHFIIDPITKKIQPENPEKNKLVRYDHNSERYTFEMDRMLEGHDMSLCDIVQIHYINVSSNKQKKNEDIYEVNDLGLLSGNEDRIAFTWLVSRNATMLDGILTFAIRFACSNGDSIDYELHTEIFSSISISNTIINNGQSIVEEYSDILNQWKKELFGIEGTIQTAKRESLAAINQNRNESLSAIKSDVKQALERIDALHTNSMSEITNNKTESIKAIELAKTNSLEAIDRYGLVQVSEDEPSNPNIDVYIRPLLTETFTIPEIMDLTISPDDTWSSEKINAELNKVNDDVAVLKEDLVELSNLQEAEIEFTITGYFASNGCHVTNEYFKSTDFVELVKDGIYIPLRYHLNGSNVQEILIYNKEKRVIKAIPLSPSSDYQVLDGVLEFEKDFYYAKFCSYSVDFDYWVKFDTIRSQIPYESLKDGMIPRHEISMEKLTGMIHDPSTNFINPLDVNKGYVNNDGEFTENDTWHNTGLIKLDSGEKYYWNGFYNQHYAFYDKSLNIVLKSTNSLPNPFIVPENAMYGLFSMDGDFSGCWIHDINKKPADYAECLNVKNVYALGKKQGVENAGKVLSVNNEGDVVPTQLKNDSGTSTKIYKKGNLLKFDEIESGYIKADGTVQPYSTLWCTGFCEVEQGKVYVKGFLLSQYFAFYDGSKKVVKTYEEGAMQQYTPQIYCIDVPTNAKYFRCTTGEDPRAATNNFFFVSNNAELPEEEDKLSFDGIFNYNVSPSNPCDYTELTVGVFNKCVFIGDSLTYGTFNMDDGASYGSDTSPQELADKYSYPSQFKKITGIDIINLGVTGETSVSWYNSHLDYNYSGCDMAIIHLGVNDAAYKVSDADTKAALINIINSLKSSVKNIKIFLCTIIPAYSNVEQTGYRQKSEVIRELYNEKYKEDINVILLDLEKYGHTKAYTSYTSGHLSALGYYVLARDIARYISWHIDNNLRDYRFIQFIGNDGLYTGD